MCVLSVPDAMGPSAGHGQSHNQASVHCLETCLGNLRWSEESVCVSANRLCLGCVCGVRSVERRYKHLSHSFCLLLVK